MNNIKTASLVSKEGGAVALVGIKIDGDVRGPLFEAVVTQTYRNDTQNAVEIIYTFPLPFAAVLLGVEVLLGAVTLKGKVVEKSHALNSYEELVSNGDTAILIERTSGYNYCMNLGNLAAGESCTIKLRYGQILKCEQGSLRLQIPTVLAPRYGDAIGDGGIEPHQEYGSDLLVSYDFELTLRLHDHLSGARISSPSHAISIRRQVKNDETQTTAYQEVGLGRSYTLDRDFVLNIDQLKEESLALQSPDYVDENKNVAFVSFNCATDYLNEGENAQSIAIKILVDCSGSMAGDSITSVRDALQFLTHELNPDDHFSLSKFGQQVGHRSRGMWKVSEASLNAARRWISDLQADMGGTELERALEETIQKAKGICSDVLLITDGAIYSIDSVIELARSSKQRIYVVGIGSSPVESHLRRLAIATGGACEFIAPGEDVQLPILRMFNRVRYPAYKNVRVVWPEGTEVRYQTSIDTVCSGDAVNVFGWTRDPIDGVVTIVGTHGACMEEITLAKVQLNSVVHSGVVSRLGAQNRLISEEIEEKDLAIAYQLISSETSMLLEHIRAPDQKQKDMPSLHKIAQMVPAGWGGTGSVQNIVRCVRLPISRETSFFADDSDKWLQRERVNALVQRILESSKPNETAGDEGFEPLKPRRKIQMTDRKNPLLWSEEQAHYGLTPMGLTDWLVVNEGLYLANSFEFLDLICVPSNVVDWLDLYFSGNYGDELGERGVVKLFVNVMRNPITLDYLKGAISKDNWLSEAPSCIKRIDLDDVMDKNTTEIVSAILEYLKDMRPTDWPESVNCLNEKL